MKEKKGFTLIELLAVIAILAILLIIAIPSVIKMYNNAKENTFIDEVQSVINTAEKQYMSDQMDSTKHTCYYKGSGTVEGCGTLELSGKDTLNYYIQFGANGKITKAVVNDGSKSSVVTNTDGLDASNVVSNTLNTDTTDYVEITPDIINETAEDPNSLKSKFLANYGPLNTLTEVSQTDLANNTGDSGLFKATGINGTTYYVRGEATNNYVQFGTDSATPMIWRIMRINEDGSIRLISETRIDNGAYYNYNDDSTDYNEMYYANSTIKTEVEDWYTTNMTSVDSKVVTSKFCVQAKVTPDNSYLSGSATMTLYSDYTPSFGCSTDGNGQGIYEAKVGLMSFDEARFAGTQVNNYTPLGGGNFYLNGAPFWTLSPAGYDDGINKHIYAWRVQGAVSQMTPYNSASTRVVISLKADVTATNGNGTSSSPWVID